jgi:hypothetical protein
MKRRLAIAVASAMLVLSAVGTAFASQPPGQLGYEGQPGNQGGASGQPASGLRGYEGQPGHQGGH